MNNISEILGLCRLCLAKEQVNVSIFEDIENRETSVKINACLPVKISENDNLPKNICNDCLYKLDDFYNFWNQSANSEKQLIQWLEDLGIHLSDISEPNHSESLVKQEKIDYIDIRNTTNNANNVQTDDAHGYIIQPQQQLPFQHFYEEAQASTSSVSEISPRKRPRRAAAMKKIIPPQELDIDDDDDDDDENDDMETVQVITKMEKIDDNSNKVHETNFGIENDQAGPSGISKTIPLRTLKQEKGKIINYNCNICLEVFPNKQDFLKHHINQYGPAFGCCKCGKKFKTITELYKHLDLHKKETILLKQEQTNKDNIIFDTENEAIEEEIISNDDNEKISGDNVVEEIILNYENDTEEFVTVESAEEEDCTTESNDLLYILDDSQCVNEVVIEEQDCENIIEKNKSDNYTIVKLEHGYMMPNVIEDDETTTIESQEDNSVLVDEDGNIVQDVKCYLPEKLQKTPSKRSYSQNRPRQPQPKRRHMVPDFSSTNYTYISPNEEVDIPHYKCLRCEQLFINKFVFFRHIEKGKCYINSCDVCSMTFNKNSEFYYHYIVEHTDRAICNFCFRTFMYEKNVKEHMLRHLDQFRHRCEECNKGFYTVREYRNHYKNRHMGIRHKCSVCGRSFADEYYFKRHLATHAKAIKVT